MSGYTRDELLGMSIGDIDAIESSAETEARIQRIMKNGSELFETCHRRKDGRTFFVEVSTTWQNENGGRLICFCRDLTERKQREGRIALLAHILDSAPVCIAIHDTEGNIFFANRATWPLHGYETEADFLAINLHDLDVPESGALLKERFRRLAEQGEARFEVEHYRKDGSTFPLDVVAKVIQWNGKPSILSIATDITDRKRAEESLRESEERFRQIYENVAVGLARVSLDFRIEQANEAYCQMLGYEEEELIGRHIRDVTQPEVVAENMKLQSQLAAGEIDHYRMEKGFIHKNGRLVYGILDACVVRNAESKPGYFLGSVIDITDRKRAEEALRKREKQLQKIFEILPIGLWFADKDGRLLRGNPMGVKIWGAEPHVPMSEYGIFKAWRLPSREPVAPDDWALVKTIGHGATIVDELLEIEAFDGKRKTILNYSTPVLDDNGKIDGAIVVNLDISDRMNLEEQLRQSQKMESVGRLAGGVAHDFNNMLGVILGHTELAMDSIPPDDPLSDDLKEIFNAAIRSADITRQLLAFARKQTISPRVIDLNSTIEGMLKMLRRLIGEDIDLAWLPGTAMWSLKMDPSQLDQILANLCVNARDAIGGVGRLTIETGTVTFDKDYCADHTECVPGDFVLLAVSDNGCGMDKQTLDNLFEPFFTTKDVGKGTGLGLATVYGIVKQNQGFINVYSEPAKGSTFRIYFPAHKVGRPEEEIRQTTPNPRARKTETILLVEDEPAILKMTTMILERLGYVVLPTHSPGEAIDLARSYGREIQLLMTDVIMPEMNGRDLAQNLLAVYPNIKRLFMSGYTADVIAHHGVLDEGVQFIQKPFSKKDLANKVRQMLDE
jgi:PAS domain S-box-containing protein